MGGGIGADRFFLRRVIRQAPHRARGLQVTCVLRHLSRQYLQEGMRMRYTRPTGKSFGCVSIVVQFRVVDESEVVIQHPLIRNVANTKFVEFNASVSNAVAVRGMRLATI